MVCFNLNKIDDDIFSQIKDNISSFNSFLTDYKNILFVCGDYPGYGGAATNCYNLQKYFGNQGYNTFGFYFNYEKGNNAKYEQHDNYVIDDINKITSITFKPDVIIVKSPVNFNLKNHFQCNVYYFIGGLFPNNLDRYYYDIPDNEIPKYINKDVINQIRMSTYSFSNSSHTRDILNKCCNIQVNLFYSSFTPYVDNKVIVDDKFTERKYQYGLIVSNFDRKIKNVDESINFLKDKTDVILIGKGSNKYKDYGFECIELVSNEKMDEYYKQIFY